ncbi:MAG: hypothetical protein FJX72_15690 [Armatimonadetes bacterium]|nr:hypothetical protein [Armatimonadota bacterium]
MEDQVALDGSATAGKSERGEATWLRRVARALRAEGIAQAPQSVLDCARTAFVEHRRNPDQVVHVARPLFDSWANLAPVALRGEAATTRHQVYSTAWHDVDLWGERLTDELWYLIGQVLPKQGGAAIRPLEALLMSSDKSVKTGVPDNGEFHIPSVHPGIYDLRLRLSGSEILLPNVYVGA